MVATTSSPPETMIRFFQNRLFLLFTGPAILVMAALTLYPMIFGLRLSLERYNLVRPWIPQRFIGLKNFSDFFQDPYLIKALAITLKFAFSTVSLQLLAGLLIALAVHRSIQKGGWLYFFVLLPMMTVPVVTGIVWRLMLNDSFGVINWILQSVGLPPQVWMGTDWAFVAVVIAETWQWLPFSVLLFSVGLASIPGEYYEAAAVDGARGWDLFFHVTLPNLKWSFLVIVIFKFSDAIKAFDIIYALTGGGPGITTRTLALYIQDTGFSDFEMGYAMALSLLILFISFIVISPFLIRLETND